VKGAPWWTWGRVRIGFAENGPPPRPPGPAPTKRRDFLEASRRDHPWPRDEPGPMQPEFQIGPVIWGSSCPPRPAAGEINQPKIGYRKSVSASRIRPRGIPARTARAAQPYRHNRASTGRHGTYADAKRVALAGKVFFIAPSQLARLCGRVAIVSNPGGTGINLSECPRGRAPIRPSFIPQSLFETLSAWPMPRAGMPWCGWDRRSGHGPVLGSQVGCGGGRRRSGLYR
jgi:hypothetical protein